MARKTCLPVFTWVTTGIAILLILLLVYMYTVYDFYGQEMGVPADGPGAAMKGVVELQPSNYDEIIGQSKYVFVEFYATWCGHCRRFAPEFAKLAAMVQEDEALRAKLIVGKMDSKRLRQLASKFKVTSYPSLFLVRPFQKKGVRYRGERSPETIMAYLKQKIK
ncbi:hypothetical protein C3747_4g720 [Trypanosoma cruzi]|uniref:Protein disulfide isomerase, putative n=2 Tax=Trypanosoma cruzi TaxID=5693 RepID=Q4CMH3_TRYCC|nr:protein disulfide isomerase, putative [Trypanosoma cruzi]EAN81476.1 protein disulfide isomerase, putative [Trypanosoma cruzi]PWV20885.1 hypothetical protein C3747_4g720 [Trypanosoma cruzi]RNC37330.1 protein disulfide isomerase [Trypanosoma cruzi]|eukprot:XP_802922.1 protein disulfide isomerase [Trypanosoma cruzi strain CL Brener]